MKTGESSKLKNDQSSNCYLKASDIGFYKVSIFTIGNDGNILRSTAKPFEIWVYPKEWEFDFY